MYYRILQKEHTFGGDVSQFLPERYDTEDEAVQSILKKYGSTAHLSKMGRVRSPMLSIFDLPEHHYMIYGSTSSFSLYIIKTIKI